MGSKVVRFLLQLSERWTGHIWLVVRMKFPSLEANLGGGRGLFSLSHSFLSGVPTSPSSSNSLKVIS